jgi:hypothetical protein
VNERNNNDDEFDPTDRLASLIERRSERKGKIRYRKLHTARHNDYIAAPKPRWRIRKPKGGRSRPIH